MGPTVGEWEKRAVVDVATWRVGFVNSRFRGLRFWACSITFYLGFK